MMMSGAWVTWEAAAAGLDLLAERIGGIVWPAERLDGEETWIGPAADDARVAIASATRDAGEAAVALRRIARELRAAAAAAREAEAARARAEALAAQ